MGWDRTSVAGASLFAQVAFGSVVAAQASHLGSGCHSLPRRSSTACRLSRNSSQTQAHHLWIISSRPGPAGTASTSAAVIRPRSGGSGKTGQARLRPTAPCARKLDLPAGEPPLDVEVEADEGERQPDRLIVLSGILGGESIDNMLMDERPAAVGERVAAQFVVGALLGGHGGGH